MLYILELISLGIISSIVFISFYITNKNNIIIKVMSKNSKNKKILYNKLYVFLKNYCKLYIFQYLNKSITKVDNKVYILSYILNGKIYKIVIKNNYRSYIPLLQISDENNEDITENILPYVGPNMDFHNILLTPDFFVYKKMTFQLDNGEELTFKENEIIKLNII